MTEQQTPAPGGFKVPADLVDTALNLTQVRQVVQIRKRAAIIARRIASLPAKLEALNGELDVLRQREAAVKAGEPDPALLVDATPDPVPEPDPAPAAFPE